MKSNFSTGVLLQICCIFSEYFFYKEHLWRAASINHTKTNKSIQKQRCISLQIWCLKLQGKFFSKHYTLKPWNLYVGNFITFKNKLSYEEVWLLNFLWITDRWLFIWLIRAHSITLLHTELKANLSIINHVNHVTSDNSVYTVDDMIHCLTSILHFSKVFTHFSYFMEYGNVVTLAENFINVASFDFIRETIPWAGNSF